MAKTPTRKTIGRRKPPAPSTARAPAAKKGKLELTDGMKELIGRLSERIGLMPREVLERALAGYAASAAPGMPLETPPKPRGKSASPTHKLFLSVDGKPEIEISQTEFVLGSGAEGVDLRLDLPLISPRHARVLWRQNSFVFEDLKSARGSYRHGQQVDVHPIQTGDEIDLGGFLPIRFRIG